MTTGSPRVRAAGESAVVIEFGDAIDLATVAKVQALDAAVMAAAARGELHGLLESVPTFRSLALVLDPVVTDPREIAEAVLALHASVTLAPATTTQRSWTLPVRYGGESGPDLDEVARTTSLDPAEVIERHATRAVRVFMLGFLPGFGFLGETDAALRLPRRREPRVRVPAGSVAIAMTLTAVYPWDSPGGWHLLGHCPIPTFDATREPATLFAPGDQVRFRAIDGREHADLLERRVAGTLDPLECLSA